MLTFSHPKRDNTIILMSYDKKNDESKIRSPVLLNSLNLLRKSDKMFSKPHILSLFHNLLDKFNKL